MNPDTAHEAGATHSGMTHAGMTHAGAARGAMNHYIRLAAMIVLSYIAMYALMYAMVDKWDDVYPNINQAYMAALMTAPMVIIELALMGAMYENKTANMAIIIASVVALALSWTMIRRQTAVGDAQFVRSMIPHHSGAILMCDGAKISDAELKELCGRIVKGQQEEIDQMRAILARIEKPRS
ncbi:DUF305 domain-containing protein [Terrarubrum flagellatum]|uniref:DUF305 domain-containing protein n=1 Tax=Terrirubrum flagellatum TaxID=2895980 RepID=UPI0031453812